MLVVGDREVADGTVSVRSRAGGDLGPRQRGRVRGEGAGGNELEGQDALGEAARAAASPYCRFQGGLIAFDRSPRRDDRVRVNERIRVREIRVIDDTGEQLGIMPPPQALAIAKQKGLDLVEISPTAVPPVCRIMDFGKYQYQEQKRAREARKHQKVIEVKEIKFRPKVDEHDYQFKKKHIERFLEDGDKVKATIFFRGPRDGAPGNRPPHSRAARPGAGRRGHRRNDAAARRQPDAHDPEPAPAGRRPGEAGGRRRDAKLGCRHESEYEPRATSHEGKTMPKLKTHRGAAKRFKRTKNGKFLRSKAFKQHILSSKTTKRKRGLRGTTTVADVDAPKLARMLPYK